MHLNIRMHKHMKNNGRDITTETQPAPNGMHTHNGFAPAFNTVGHTHASSDGAPSSGPAIYRVPDAEKQRI